METENNTSTGNEPYYGEEENQEPYYGEDETSKTEAEGQDQAAMRPTGSGGSKQPSQ